MGNDMKKFVTFEGIDGSGKSTVSKKVYDRLISDGYDVILTFEPTDTWLGKVVNRCIDEHCDPLIITFTFIADRIEHVKKIRQGLKDGKIVLCDRYVDSTFAYQGAQLKRKVKNPIKWLKSLHKEFIVEPDLTLLFVLDSGEALRRIQNRAKLISFEKKEFLSVVQDNYLKLAKNKRFITLDANKKIDELTEECINYILA